MCQDFSFVLPQWLNDHSWGKTWDLRDFTEAFTVDVARGSRQLLKLNDWFTEIIWILIMVWENNSNYSTKHSSYHAKIVIIFIIIIIILAIIFSLNNIIQIHIKTVHIYLLIFFCLVSFPPPESVTITTKNFDDILALWLQ